MSSRIRFNEAGDVFSAFPGLARLSIAPKQPIDALAYASELIGVSPPSAAIAYIAHLLPRREAVWWGCQCVGAILGAAAEDEAMRLAKNWVRDTDDAVRRNALAYAETGNHRLATTWLARAAGFSGGSILAAEQPPMAPGPEACAQSINAAIAIAATSVQPLMMLPWFRACAEAGVRFAAGEEARVIAPPVSRPGSPAAAPPAA